MKIESRFGKKIREFRIDRGWSQEQLAEIAGIATRTVQRVEKDQTRDGETLQAIAAAFDVTVKDLRTSYWVAESHPPKALMIESADDFRTAIQRAYHFHTYRSLVEPRPESEARIRELVETVFADLWAMEPDEPELITSYIDSIREPLVELKNMGMTFFQFSSCAMFSSMGNDLVSVGPWRTLLPALFLGAGRWLFSGRQRWPAPPAP